MRPVEFSLDLMIIFQQGELWNRRLGYQASEVVGYQGCTQLSRLIFKQDSLPDVIGF